MTSHGEKDKRELIIENNFFHTKLGFSHIYTNGTYRSHKTIIFNTIDMIHLKCDCIDGSIVNGIRGPISVSFALNVGPGHRKIERLE